MHAKSLSRSTPQSCRSEVYEYKLQLMPIVTDNRAHVQQRLQYVHVEHNKEQMSGCCLEFLQGYTLTLPHPFLSSSSSSDKHNRRLD